MGIIKWFLIRLGLYGRARHWKLCIHPKEQEYLWVRQNLTDYDILIDVGANLGMYSYLFSLNKNAQVICIEPNKFLHDWLIKILPSKVEHINAACGKKSEIRTLYIPKHEMTSGRSSLKPRVANLYTQELISKQVQTIRLSKKLMSFRFNRALVKIDVEGCESEIIEEMCGVLETADNIDIMLEIAKFEENFLLPAKILESIGYSIFIYNSGSDALQQISYDMIERYVDGNHFNFIFMKK